MKRMSSLYLALCAVALLAQTVRADYITRVYGHSAGTDGIQIFDINVDTGAVTAIDHITQGLAANQIAPGNGRGVVTVGDTIYYTYAGDGGGVYSYNLATHTNNGLLFNVAGANGLSTAAWNGSELIFSDYSGTDRAFFYTPTGTLVNTVHLQNAGGFYDGLEFANGGLIANRGDTFPPYDQYGIGGGAPTTSAFIDAGAHSPSDTGIAFDGTYYFISEIFAQKIGIYDATGAFIKEVDLSALSVPGCSPGLCIEDLSVDYNLVLPPPVSAVPEPSTIMLLGTGALWLGWRLRRKRA